MNREEERGPIRYERVYDASVEDLWALWTTKEGLEEWFTPTGLTLDVPVLEVREGGRFEHVMTAVADDAIAYMKSVGRPLTTRASGHFVEVRPCTRLHLRFTMDFLPGQDSYPFC